VSEPDGWGGVGSDGCPYIRPVRVPLETPPREPASDLGAPETVNRYLDEEA